MRQNILHLSLTEMEDFFKRLDLEPYRARQVFQWLWQKGMVDFEKMTNLSLNLRKMLNEKFMIEHLNLLKRLRASDGAEKFLWQLEDKNAIESVFIPEPPRKTICISTQIGCPLSCSFCATGQLGFKRSLLAFEIASQVQQVQNLIGEKLTNVVFMGMGEPLLNIEDVNGALEIITSSIGLGISQRHITISTAGVVEGMEYLLNSKWKVKLAISLNFADESKREEYMPVSKNNKLKDVLKIANEYATRKQMVTFEYVLIKGINDSLEDARQLLRLLKSIPSKINLIPYNEHPDLPYQTPDKNTIDEFQRVLFNSNHPVILRKSKGKEIFAACGQLAGQCA
ncbi:MAG: 23S rRNA (adenine(2503)-C(2))-methyltransferase RlmN [bacterium]